MYLMFWSLFDRNCGGGSEDQVQQSAYRPGDAYLVRPENPGVHSIRPIFIEEIGHSFYAEIVVIYRTHESDCDV